MITSNTRLQTGSRRHPLRGLTDWQAIDKAKEIGRQMCARTSTGLHRFYPNGEHYRLRQ